MIAKISKTLIFSACLALSGIYAHAETPVTVVAIEKPAAGTVIVSAKPKVSLSLLTAAGTKDPKVEWSENATNYLNEAADEALKAKSYEIARMDMDQVDSPEAVQVIKLKDAVTDSIAMNGYFLFKLPTKSKFEWTLGDRATLLIPEGSSPDKTPRYALFMTAEGSYSSGGRAALMVGAAILGAAIPTGGQYVQASLVDLKTGQMVWYEMTIVAPGTDIRTKEGAVSLMTTLFKKLPL